jgi:hypothetical protein
MRQTGMRFVQVVFAICAFGLLVLTLSGCISIG